jgi:hypothetical protein
MRITSNTGGITEVPQEYQKQIRKMIANEDHDGVSKLVEQFKKGGMLKRKDGSYSRRGLWDNIRANRGSGRKPTKQMLEQERKIRGKYGPGGYTSQQDSVKHLAGQTMDFEATKGSPMGTGLSDWGYHSSQLPYNMVPSNWKAPSTREEAVDLYMQEIGSNPIMNNFSTAMEKAEAGDFLYNTGKDPRVYMLDQYLKSKGQSGLPNRGSYNVDTKTSQWTPELQQSLDSLWNQYSPEIQKLSTNDRRILLNKGRDFYYKNTYSGDPGDKNDGVTNWGFDANGNPKRGADGSLSPAYGKTWRPRIWKSVNTYNQKQAAGGVVFEGYVTEQPISEPVPFHHSTIGKKMDGGGYTGELLEGNISEGLSISELGPTKLFSSLWEAPYSDNGRRYIYGETPRYPTPLPTNMEQKAIEAQGLYNTPGDVRSLVDRIYINPLKSGDGYDDLYYDAGLSIEDSQEGARYLQNTYGNRSPQRFKKYGKGGYTVKRSSARKGKTHVVIGPDGTKKYFGDSKLGQHPKDPARKKSFYARHAKNLKGNPYFRAFARATWADGGKLGQGIYDMGLMPYGMGGHTQEGPMSQLYAPHTGESVDIRYADGGYIFAPKMDYDGRINVPYGYNTPAYNERYQMGAGGFFKNLGNTALDAIKFGADATLSTLGAVTTVDSLKDVVKDENFKTKAFDKASNVAGGIGDIVATGAKFIPGVNVIAGAAGAVGGLADNAFKIDQKNYDPTEHQSKFEKIAGGVRQVGDVAGMFVNPGAAVGNLGKVANTAGNIGKYASLGNMGLNLGNQVASGQGINPMQMMQMGMAANNMFGGNQAGTAGGSPFGQFNYGGYVYMADGGQTGLVPINVEGANFSQGSGPDAKKGELLVINGKIIKNYVGRPPHPTEGQNPMGNDDAPEGLIVIPKARTEEYLEAGLVKRKQIERSLVSQQQHREMKKSREMGDGGYYSFGMGEMGMADGGPIGNPEIINDITYGTMKKGGWIQKATASIKRRGTEGVCTGSKFGSSSCPPGSRRYNLAKTFRKMARSKKEYGGFVDPVTGQIPNMYAAGGQLPEGLLRTRMKASGASPEEINRYVAAKYEMGGPTNVDRSAIYAGMRSRFNYGGRAMMQPGGSLQDFNNWLHSSYASGNPEGHFMGTVPNEVYENLDTEFGLTPYMNRRTSSGKAWPASATGVLGKWCGPNGCYDRVMPPYRTAPYFTQDDNMTTSSPIPYSDDATSRMFNQVTDAEKNEMLQGRYTNPDDYWSNKYAQEQANQAMAQRIASRPSLGSLINSQVRTGSLPASNVQNAPGAPRLKDQGSLVTGLEAAPGTFDYQGEGVPNIYGYMTPPEMANYNTGVNTPIVNYPINRNLPGSSYNAMMGRLNTPKISNYTQSMDQAGSDEFNSRPVGDTSRYNPYLRTMSDSQGMSLAGANRNPNSMASLAGIPQGTMSQRYMAGIDRGLEKQFPTLYGTSDLMGGTSGASTPGQSPNYGNMAQDLAGMAPVLYNLGRGIFEKPVKMNALDYETPYMEFRKTKFDATPYAQATSRALYGAPTGPGSRAYRTSLASQMAQARSQGYMDWMNRESARRQGVDEANMGIAARNRAMKLQVDLLNQQARANRNKYFETSTEQLAQEFGRNPMYFQALAGKTPRQPFTGWRTPAPSNT